MERRWSQHIIQAKSSKGGRWHFPNAIRKYRKDAFAHEVLEVCTTLEEANEAEDAWIESFSTRDPKFGFNLAKGGEHKPHGIRKNPWGDPEYRAKLSFTLNMAATRTPQAKARRKAALESSESKAIRSASSKEIWARPGFREKMASMTSILSVLKNNSERLREEARKKRESKTYILCKEHGKILTKQCYEKRKKDGRIHYSCKECTKRVNNTYERKKRTFI